MIIIFLIDTAMLPIDSHLSALTEVSVIVYSYLAR